MSPLLATRGRPLKSPSPLISIYAAPRIDPPFDDELPPSPWPGIQSLSRPGRAGEMGLQLVLDFSEPATRKRRPRPTPPTPPPDPGTTTEARVAARRFISTCLEVLNGYRPTTHLRSLTTPLDYFKIAEQVNRAKRRSGIPPGASPARTTPKIQTFLRELRICEPRLGIAEVAAVVGCGSGVWAMAIRLERQQKRWLCTVAEVI